MGSRSGGRNRVRQSRALDTSGTTLTLTHRPTGISAQGEVPRGHYSRAELRKQRAALSARLLAELEVKVAHRLRIPGFGGLPPKPLKPTAAGFSRAAAPIPHEAW